MTGLLRRFYWKERIGRKWFMNSVLLLSVAEEFTFRPTLFPLFSDFKYLPDLAKRNQTSQYILKRFKKIKGFHADTFLKKHTILA
jgi:hypothetical protein